MAPASRSSLARVERERAPHFAMFACPILLTAENFLSTLAQNPVTRIDVAISSGVGGGGRNSSDGPFSAHL